MAKWEVVVGIVAYTSIIFIAGALFGRWLWARVSEPDPEERWCEAQKCAVTHAASIVQRYEP